MTVSTRGYGGRDIRETVRIYTDDPVHRIMVVTMMGQVEKFAEIRPERVRLTGEKKDAWARVEIIPRKEYPFTIKNISARDGRFIQWRLEERCGERRDRCVLKVEAKESESRGFADILFVETDSPLQPKIPIFITGSTR